MSHILNSNLNTIPPYGYPKRKIYDMKHPMENGQVMVSYNGILTKNALVQTVGNGFISNIFFTFPTLVLSLIFKK